MQTIELVRLIQKGSDLLWSLITRSALKRIDVLIGVPGTVLIGQPTSKEFHKT